jgi:hypothetical protein
MAEKTVARTRAEAHFSASEQRDALVKAEIARASAATDAKTARLKALRLAKEAEEAQARALAPTPPPKKKKAPRRITAG